MKKAPDWFILAANSNIKISIIYEANESAVCDVIKICLKRRIATRSGKGNQPLNIKTAVERPILKLGLPNFRWSMTFSSASLSI